MSDLASGFDLYAAVAEPYALSRVNAPSPTGFAIAMPAELEAQIRPRSGFAFKHGITALNSPGTIDADYRGEIKVFLINHGKEAILSFNARENCSDGFPNRPDNVSLKIDELSDTVRGAGGFGHTGV